ncbi:MAG: hypothetical protein AUG09_04390 [Acidobacteria bacterium 13_1_20CM_2_68_7]|nr:MAG: hypothetical protein AUG09_04390 [Acidobacteria bacterium 13_1_20CM_2_68_7]
MRVLRNVWARAGSLQRAGSATFVSISASSRERAGRSKMPPELRETALERFHSSHQLVDFETTDAFRHGPRPGAPDQVAERENAARSAAV